MSKGAGNSWLCGASRRGSDRGKQIVYGKYLNICEDVRNNLTDWLEQKKIVLKPMKGRVMFPLLTIMYIDDVEEYCRKEESIEKEIQDLGFRGLLVLIHEGNKPRRQVKENVIQLRSEKKEICQTLQNEDEIGRMMRFIQEKARMLAFSHDREKTDSVLLNAVKFIEKECNIRLVDVNDPPKDVTNVKGIEESPLVIFCKNDSQLQEDIDHAKKNARCGPDVMLLVLTNRNDMHLVDTKATEGFYMKSQLIFSSIRKKFRKKKNLPCILWLHNFIELNGYNVSRRLSRSESLQLSFRQLRRRKEEGFYEKLRNVSEEMEKFVVIYFQVKQNLSLHRMEDCQESRPFILFCRDGESAEDDINQFIKESQATSDLHMTVVVLLRCERQKPVDIPNVPNIQRLSIHSSQEPAILPTPANGRVANKVREFLLAKRFDKQSIIKKEEEVTYNSQRSTEEENKMSVATNSMKRQPETISKYVTQHDTRGSVQVRHALPACDTDKSILEEKNRSCENFLNQDKKTAILSSQEKDQGIKKVLNPALKTCMTSQDPAHSKDPKNASKPRARRQERDAKNERESNTRADTKHDNQESLQPGLQEGQTSSFSQDTLHESSRSLKYNDAHQPTLDAITEKSLISASENEADMKSTQNDPAACAGNHSEESQGKSTHE